MILAGRKLVLASASPRRMAILQQLGLEPEQLPVNIEEKTTLVPGECAGDLVIYNSLIKARAAAAKCTEDEIIIGSDTVVVLSGTIFGKPKSRDEAFSMLNALSGKTHQVYTGLSLIDRHTGKEYAEADVCNVSFADVSPREINDYIDTGEPMDKAGAYGIQEKGAFLVKKINGDFYTVMGLPVALLYKMWHNIEDIG